MSPTAEHNLVLERVEALLNACPPAATEPDDFWAAQFDHGLAWVRFPPGRGGLGVSARWQEEVDRRLRCAGASFANRDINVIGLGHAAATVLEHARPEVADRLLRPLFTADEIWCQLFSEPGAGSDLAGLATSAVADGGEWVVNGQKVWTTLAHRARWALLLARSDPDVPKHKGLTCFVLDMSAPGVEVRPLYEMTGEAEFNEVYLSAVRVADTMRLGEIGGGWAVAMTTLMNERTSAGREIGPRGSGPIAAAIEVWQRAHRNDPVRQDELMKHWVEAEVLRLTEIRAAETAGTGTPGPQSSVAKLRWSELRKSITSFTVDLLGPAGMTYPGGYEFVQPESSQVSAGSVQKTFLRSRANSIEGGTSEIMRNILAERVLGLPAEPRTDSAVPWREVPRG
jgi:alkylation response protein AidB-like acyl-CoA dehydrogenase